MENYIDLGEKRVKIVCNALLPRLYRFQFGRDLISDMRKMAKSYKRVGETEDGKPIYEIDDNADFSVAENLAFIMLKQGGEDVGETIDEWLETISISDLYALEQACFELWRASERQTSTAKKKGVKPHA
ncbi:MAG: hypothetical protein IJG87_02300 [Ruminococcus sp.]|nr:hypothetical protein [Ruminococcus sp.]